MKRSKPRERSGCEPIEDWAGFEAADFLLDMETSVPNRKRAWNVDAGNGMLDANYITFLQGLHDYWDAKFGEEEEEKDDPSYMLFFNTLKHHGNAYMCDVSEEHGVYDPIIYEEESDYLENVKKRTARMSISQEHLHHGGDMNMKSGRKNSVAENVSCDDLKKRSFDGVVGRKSRVKKSELGSDRSAGMKRGRKISTNSRDDHLKENRRLDLDAGQRSGPKCSNFKKRMPEMDEAYDTFMKNLKLVKGYPVVKLGQNQVCYEIDNQQLPDVQVEPLQTHTPSPSPRPPLPFSTPLTSPSRAEISKPKKGTPKDALIPNKTHNNDNIKQFKEEILSYQRELREDLRRPYDKDEYETLYKFVSGRTEVQIYRESRSGGSYRPAGHLGKSYLDLYPDLKRKIEKVKSDRRKVLNLLRMCKIYVQKIPSLPTGYKQPWMEDTFLAILP